jgi:tRNA C32,U32 (ribose-2'-O)-methylase TrmJ
VANACDVRVTIPMARDSVNAAMAATVALYEIARAGYAAPAPTPSSTSDDTGSAS